MTTRRELFPLVAGAAGLRRPPPAPPPAAAPAPGVAARLLPERAHRRRARLLRLSTARLRQTKDWPVMLFLHGDGERGDGKGELDYVLMHGPLYEAWCQKRDLPFVIISPQLPMFGQADDRLHQEPHAGADSAAPARHGVESAARRSAACASTSPCRARCRDDKLPDGPDGPGRRLERDRARIDRDGGPHRRASSEAIARRVYLTGLSYGGFGAWHLAARHPDKFAALAPVVGLRPPGSCRAHREGQTTAVVFAGGRDPVVPLRYFYAGARTARGAGPPDVRFTESRRPRALHLGARVRRPGPVRLVAGPLALTVARQKKGRQLALPPRFALAEDARLQNRPRRPKMIVRPALNALNVAL